MTTTLVVFARAPVRGQVKTRLARGVGEDAALALHRAFLADVCAAAEGVAARRVLAVAGDPDHAGLDGLPLERVEQGEGDLGARMARALARYVADGPVCLIGCDAPTVPRAYLEEAFVRLGEVDLVVGPSTDGGYWLVGARRPAPELFEDVAWGTEAVLPETLRRLRGRSHALLPFWYDVDDVEDLALLRAHLGVLGPEVAARTRAVLGDGPASIVPGGGLY